MDPMPMNGWFYVDLGTSWRPLARPWESADAVAKSVMTNAAGTVEVSWSQVNDAAGFFDPVVHEQAFEIRAVRADGTPLPVDRLQSLLADLRSHSKEDGIGHLIEQTEPIGGWAVSAGVAARSRRDTRWLAVLNNSVAGVTFVGLLWSLGWIPREARRWRETRRLARKECPHCGYNRAATPAEALCPECGRLNVIE